MNHGDRDYSVQAFENQCRRWPRCLQQLILWSKSAWSVSYFRSFNEPRTCDSNDNTQAGPGARADCSWYNLGWESFSGGGNRGHTIGYDNAAACFFFLKNGS